ncbi:MAG: hypothetical protein ACYTHN_11810 [Planctomycetota bacterium]|jgi:hypothetical protein
MMDKSIEVLDRLLDQYRLKKRPTRLKDLLRDPSGGRERNWQYFTPPCFNDALDIRLTDRVREGRKTPVWTQGGNFSFKVGDVLYDCPAGYGAWENALQKIKGGVQVISARDVSPPTKEKERDPGQVTAVLLKPDKKRKSLVRDRQLILTQDEFVRFLILGKEGPSP